MNHSLTYEGDLHNHTTCSDGSYTPAELIHAAHELGLKAIAITDHDTIEGLKEGKETADQYNLEFIPGLEITTRFKETYFTGSLHLLVYFSYDLLNNKDFVTEAEDVLSAGRGPELVSDRIKSINHYFSPNGVSPILPRILKEEDVYAHGDRISRRHFAMAINTMGISDKSIVTQIIGNDSPAYIPSGVKPSRVKSFLLKWPLTRVLAHPAAGSYPGDCIYREVLPPFEVVEKLLPVFMELGLDGFEVEYPGHTEEWKQRLRLKMKELGLVIETGGSDCHDMKERPLGQNGVSMETVRRLQESYSRDN